MRTNESINFYQLPIQAVLTQNHKAVSWLGQSKEYQELLGT